MGSHPEDRSPFGVLDMAGNVSEWTSSTNSANYSQKRSEGRGMAMDGLARGGCNDCNIATVRTAERGGCGFYRHSKAWALGGFRCALGNAPPPVSPPLSTADLIRLWGQVPAKRTTVGVFEILFASPANGTAALVLTPNGALRTDADTVVGLEDLDGDGRKDLVLSHRESSDSFGFEVVADRPIGPTKVEVYSFLQNNGTYAWANVSLGVFRGKPALLAITQPWYEEFGARVPMVPREVTFQWGRGDGLWIAAKRDIKPK